MNNFKGKPVAMGVGGYKTPSVPSVKSNPFQVNQFGNFKEFSAGAGSTIFKVNKEGVFCGGNKYSTAPFKLSFNSVLRMGLATGSGIGIDGNTGTLDFYFNNVKTGLVSGLQTAHGAETFYVSISNVVGRSIDLGASGVYCNGTFYPSADIGDSLGSSTIRWNEVWAKTIIASGTGSKFSIQGHDGYTGDLKYVDWDGVHRTGNVIGGIITGV